MSQYPLSPEVLAILTPEEKAVLEREIDLGAEFAPGLTPEEIKEGAQASLDYRQMIATPESEWAAPMPEGKADFAIGIYDETAS